MPPSTFANRVLHWFDQHGRKDLPWQQTPTPYRVWVSEIMLQQTQVSTVIPYYQEFITTFPDVITLANAEQDRVLQYWAGLGYYSRARNLHKAAQQVRDNFQGVIPDTLDALTRLSGIGRSTAGAILSLAFHQPQPILDGNVKRVLARYHALSGWPGKSAVQKHLWTLAESHLPTGLPAPRHADYTQAMMDLGATVCTRNKPACLLCPLQADCQGLKAGNPTAYPGSKPRKKIPDKHTLMLLLMNDKRQVLLQKRPAPGIWGGLWSLPQFENMTACHAWYTQRYTEPFPDTEELPGFIHTFSHFRLHVQPFLTAPAPYSPKDKGVMEENDSLWYNSGTHFTGGLPAPVKKLFKRIQL